jgi:REP element-mobilizing transposase RayT
MPNQFNSHKHHRRSIRMKGYDYSQPGAYFVTLCTWQRECLFGEVVNGELHLNEMGRIVLRAWRDLPNHYPHLELGEFCILPNHVHAIMILTDHDSRRGGSVPDQANHDDRSRPDQVTESQNLKTRPYTPVRHGLPEIIRAFKSFSARSINFLRHTSGTPVWQRNYYEHIIRDEIEWRKINDYIATNPADWDHDQENPPNEWR